MTDATNRRVSLARRPQGAPKLDDFVTDEVPAPAVGPGQGLLRNLFLSLDPYMRGLMDEGESTYAPRAALGEALGGGTVAEVAVSNLDGYRAGDLVVARGGWQTFALTDGSDLRRLPRDMEHPSLALGRVDEFRPGTIWGFPQLTLSDSYGSRCLGRRGRCRRE